ncbi:hypothetical protein PMEGAPL125_14080 [Priestia megaterium]
MYSFLSISFIYRNILLFNLLKDLNSGYYSRIIEGNKPYQQVSCMITDMNKTKFFYYFK